MRRYHIKCQSEVVSISAEDHDIDPDRWLELHLSDIVIATFKEWEYFYSEEEK